MTLLCIEARDPLIFRDGRPNDGRSESRTLDFPIPSAIAGAVRTILGSRGGKGFNPDLIPQLLDKVSLRGPLLASGAELFVPAPADALVLKLESGELKLLGLHPIALPPGAACSATSPLVGLNPEENELAKPFSDAPRYWPWSSFEGWLRDPRPRTHEQVEALCKSGLRPLAREERIHVAMGPQGTAEDGKLFATEGLRLMRDEAWEELVFAVNVQIDEPALGSIPPGLRPLGGERRLARWSEQPPGVSIPEPPAWLLEHVQKENPIVRVILLTPAYVNSSLEPACLNTGGARVVGAKVDRPRTISGWDMKLGQPKKTRRLVAAGTVYWVELSDDAAARTRWVKEHWMQNIGDDEQLRRDGFGLVALGMGGSP